MEKDIEHLTLEQTLGHAIESEKAAIEFYTSLKDFAGINSLVIQLFTNIIKDEETHMSVLLTLHESLFDTQDYLSLIHI